MGSKQPIDYKNMSKEFIKYMADISDIDFVTYNVDDIYFLLDNISYVFIETSTSGLPLIQELLQSSGSIISKTISIETAENMINAFNEYVNHANHWLFNYSKTQTRMINSYKEDPSKFDTFKRTTVNLLKNVADNFDKVAKEIEQKMNTNRPTQQGGVRSSKKSCSWARSGRKLPDGRVLWRNSHTNELRIRKMITIKGERKFKYVKPSKP